MSLLPNFETVSGLRKRAESLRGLASKEPSKTKQTLHEQAAQQSEDLAAQLEQKLKDLRQLAHVAKRDLIRKGKLRNDDDYRLLLAKATETRPDALDGKHSTADMLTLNELEAVMKAFRKKGFRVTHPGKSAPAERSRPLAQEPQDKKVRALWLDMHKQGIVSDASEEALAKWIKREFEVEALQWLAGEQCAQAIERLKKWQRRVLAQRAKAA